MTPCSAKTQEPTGTRARAAAHWCYVPESNQFSIQPQAAWPPWRWSMTQLETTWEEWFLVFLATVMDRCWKWCVIPVGANKESLAFWRVLHLELVLYKVLTWCYHPKHRGDCILGTDHTHISCWIFIWLPVKVSFSLHPLSSKFRVFGAWLWSCPFVGPFAWTLWYSVSCIIYFIFHIWYKF